MYYIFSHLICKIQRKLYSVFFNAAKKENTLHFYNPSQIQEKPGPLKTDHSGIVRTSFLHSFFVNNSDGYINTFIATI